MPISPKRKSRGLFTQHAKPVPLEVQQLQKEYAEKRGKLRTIARANTQHIFNTPRGDFVTELENFAKGVSDLEKERALQEKINGMKRKLKAWEKYGKKRSRGIRGLIRVIHSPRAAIRLRQIRNVRNANEKLAELDILKQIVESGLASRYDLIRYELRLADEKKNRRTLEKSARRAKERATRR